MIFRIILFILFFTNLFASNIKDVSFTHKEKVYIKEHPVVSIAMMNNFKPFSFVENNTHQGLSVDILHKISKISGLKFDINVSKWSEGYKKFMEGKFDLISGISHSKQRESFTLFTSSFYEIPIFIFGMKYDSDYKNNSSLAGKRVGISFDMYYKQKLIDLGIEVVEFDSSNEKAKALALGQIDYYLASYTSGTKAINTQFLTNIKPLDEYKAIKKEDLRYGIKTSEKTLHSIMEKSLNAIGYKEFDALVNQWIVGLNSLKINSLSFNKQELDYLTQYPIIKVHNELDWAPYNYNIKGEAKGFSIDYMNLLSSKIGISVEYVSGTWNSLLNSMKKNELDVMLNIVQTQEREKYLNFTMPYTRIFTAVYVKKGDEKRYKDISSFNGKRMVVIKNFYEEELLKKHYPAINIVTVDNTLDGLKKVSFNEAQGMIINMGVAEYTKSIYNLVNVIPSFEIADNKLNLRMATSKENIILRDILQKGQEQITHEEILALKQKWLLSNPIDKNNLLNLNNAETRYLKSKKEIKMCVHPQFMPFEGLQNGKHTGLSSEYFKLFREKFNLPIRVVATKSWKHSLENIKNKKCDILSLSLKTNLIHEQLNFTHAYINLPIVLATKQDVGFISELDQLKGRKIAILEGYNSADMIEKKYSDITIVKYETTQEALEDVVDGKIFGFFGTVVDIGYVFQNNFIGQLKIAGKFDEKINFSIAVRSDEQELLGILNNAVNQITEDMSKKIINKYVSIEYANEFDYEMLLQILFVLILIAIVLIYRQVMLNKVNRTLKELAFKDQLTNIKNRHYFFEVTENLFTLSKRNNTKLSIILMDIDFFKNINDSYGHMIGDEILKHLAVTISKVLRDCDVFARFGGEEFIITLPNTSSKGALKVAHKIQNVIANTPYKNKGIEIVVKLSLGVCEYKDETTIEELFNKADIALYDAKESGRNQVKEFVQTFSTD